MDELAAAASVLAMSVVESDDGMVLETTVGCVSADTGSAPDVDGPTDTGACGLTWREGGPT